MNSNGDSIELLNKILFSLSFQEIPEDVLSLLSNSITDNDSSSYNQDVIDTICVLALCGWNTR
jgi:hypothetical protein